MMSEICDRLNLSFDESRMKSHFETGTCSQDVCSRGAFGLSRSALSTQFPCDSVLEPFPGTVQNNPNPARLGTQRIQQLPLFERLTVLATPQNGSIVEQ